MKYIIIGLGNPGREYEGTRHNIGRATAEYFSKKNKFPEWEFDRKVNALLTEGKVGKHDLALVLPETFMNKSGEAVRKIKNQKSKIKNENIVVVHDDLDLPVGTVKIVFNRGSGGHRGVESIMKALKTKEFIRLRIGVSQKKKLHGDKKINDFILGHFKPSELDVLKKVMQKAEKALGAIVAEGKERAMNEYN